MKKIEISEEALQDPNDGFSFTKLKIQGLETTLFRVCDLKSNAFGFRLEVTVPYIQIITESSAKEFHTEFTTLFPTK